MPVTPTYPGVYIEEIPSGVRTITGVATSITAFVGYTARGLDNRAKRLFSFADFERSFGGIASHSELSYAVDQFFGNGGTNAYVVRVPRHNSKPASVILLDGVAGVAGGAKPALQVTALSNGTWSDNLVLDVDYDAVSDNKSFNLTITDLSSPNPPETFRNVTMDKTARNYVVAVINDNDSGSQTVSVSVPDPNAGRPAGSGISGGDITLANIKNDKTYTIKLITDVPSYTVEFPFINSGEAVPGSITSACRMFERQANSALTSVVPGARVQCLPSSTGKGLRVRALLPNAYDAQVTFGKGTTDDADAFLNLSASNPAANVSHYWPNSQRPAPGNAFAQASPMRGSDGDSLPQTVDLIGDPAAFTGIYALDKVDLFNILCIPDATRASVSDPTKLDANLDPNAIFGAAITYCGSRRAFLLIDAPPEVANVEKAVDWKTTELTVHDRNGAAYFPRLKLSDPLNNFQLRSFAPCGVVAGLFSRIDAARGVWKAPAGTEATLAGVQGMVYKLTDPENGALNPIGLNCFRIFPIYGSVCWGARTLVGADADASEWKYVPVRRLALFLEESLYRGTQWVVFEPNDEPLWAQIRLNIGAFMQDLFRKGAFQGKTPRDAYFVKCDNETTTQNDINLGIVNIVVGFAPLKPAEFVIIKIQQLAGQIQT